MEAKRKIWIHRRSCIGLEKQDSNLRSYMIAKVLALGLIFLLAGPLGMTVPAVANGDLSFHKIKVMTQNLYVGADIFRPATAVDLNEFYVLLEETFDVLKSTKISERAQAMAKEVARHRPHLIGLQEVYQILLEDEEDSSNELTWIIWESLYKSWRIRACTIHRQGRYRTSTFTYRHQRVL